MAATGAIALVYLANMVMSLFFHTQMSFLYSSTPLGIGISVVVVIIAALNLVLDFDMIETGARMGAPKYMEWYGAFAHDGHADLVVPGNSPATQQNPPSINWR